MWRQIKTKINSILAAADNYKFSHKNITPTHTGNLFINSHNMTHLSDFPNLSYTPKPCVDTKQLLFLIQIALQKKLHGDRSKQGQLHRCYLCYYKFSHKNIKPTHTDNLFINSHNMTHLSDFLNFSKFRIEHHYAPIDQCIPQERLQASCLLYFRHYFQEIQRCTGKQVWNDGLGIEF